MAKQKANLTTVGQIQSDLQDAYLSAPMIAAPNTLITDMSGSARQIRDPSQTLKPTMGIERINARAIELVVDEKGPNGEPVWRLSTGDERIRFIGYTWANASTTNGSGPQVTSGTTGEYIEVTFYGTGLNILDANGSSRGLVASVDGGAEGANILPDVSGVFAGRGNVPNMLYKVTSGLTLGTHTVRLRKSVSGYSLQPYGFEILNQDSSITIPKGEILSGGKKQVNSAASTMAYNSGFDGSPVLNGRGGRVVIYSKDGVTGKVIQQTNASALTLGSTNHSNEEVIRKINVREFGVNRADDFSGATSSAKAFTLDNGTTTLMVTSGVGQVISGIDGFAYSAINNSFFITFVGTGLDVATVTNAAYNATQTVSIDGGSASTITFPVGSYGITKVVSGLPYGTHTVKFTLTASVAGQFNFVDFFIFGPKKPAIPAGAVQTGEYYLMANFVNNSTQASEALATGVLRKAAVREFLYTGASWTSGLTVGTGTAGAVAGFRALGAAAAQVVTYSFYGTGFDLRISTPVAVNTFTVAIDGTNPTAAGATATGFYGQFSSFVAGTGVATSNGTGQFANGLWVSGLPLGFHTVTLTQNAATSFGFESIDIITPIHFPANKRGSLSLNPDVAFFRKFDKLGKVDLSKAKAWLKYDGVNDIILSSNNIANVIHSSAGHYIVYLERPMKNKHYAIIGMAQRYATGVGQVNTIGIDDTSEALRPKFDHFDLHSLPSGAAGNDAIFSVVVFGELFDEDEG